MSNMQASSLSPERMKSPHPTPSQRERGPEASLALAITSVLAIVVTFIAGPRVAFAQAKGDAVAAEFLATWKKQSDPTFDANATWREFAQKNTKHDLAAVANVMVAIHLLRDQNDADGAMKLVPFEAGDGASELRKQMAQCSKGLAARAKMMRLTKKLQDYYKKKVEYPATLDELIKAKIAVEADVTDPFGQRFGYEARAKKIAPKLPRQEYTLTCVTLNATHDTTKKSLSAVTDTIKTMQMTSVDAAAKQAFVRRAQKSGQMGPSSAWNVGQSAEGYTLAAVYDENFVVLVHENLPRLLIKE